MNPRHTKQKQLTQLPMHTKRVIENALNVCSSINFQQFWEFSLSLALYLNCLIASSLSRCCFLRKQPQSLDLVKTEAKLCRILWLWWCFYALSWTFFLWWCADGSRQLKQLKRTLLRHIKAGDGGKLDDVTMLRHFRHLNESVSNWFLFALLLWRHEKEKNMSKKQLRSFSFVRMKKQLAMPVRFFHED